MNAVEICNMALDHLGQQSTIADLDENTPEASRCKRHYEPALKAALRAFDWPFARGYQAAAALQPDTALDLPGWSYRYAYPNGCVRLWGVVQSPTERPKEKFLVTTTMESGKAGQVVFANLAAAWFRFTRAITDPTYFDPMFVDAFAFNLAFRLAMAVTRDDKKQANALTIFNNLIAQAREAAANEEGETLPDDIESATIAVRGAIG